MSEQRSHVRAPGTRHDDPLRAARPRHGEASPSFAQLAGFDALAPDAGVDRAAWAPAPVQIALLQRLQQTWGNRAATAYVQRLLVQRCGGVPCDCASEERSGPRAAAQDEAAPSDERR